MAQLLTKKKSTDYTETHRKHRDFFLAFLALLGALGAKTADCADCAEENPQITQIDTDLETQITQKPAENTEILFFLASLAL